MQGQECLRCKCLSVRERDNWKRLKAPGVIFLDTSGNYHVITCITRLYLALCPLLCINAAMKLFQGVKVNYGYIEFLNIYKDNT